MRHMLLILSLSSLIFQHTIALLPSSTRKFGSFRTFTPYECCVSTLPGTLYTRQDALLMRSHSPLLAFSYLNSPLNGHGRQSTAINRFMRNIRKILVGLVAALTIRFSLNPHIAYAAAPSASVESSVLVDDDNYIFDNELELEDTIKDETPKAKVVKTKSKGLNIHMKNIATYTVVVYLLGKLLYTSATDLSKQRKRIREENTKFQQNAEEYMIDVEVAYNEDIMRELRNRKEANVGPYDKYAKETRRYNPDFAATHEPLDAPETTSEVTDDLLDQKEKAEAEERKKADQAAAFKKLFEKSSTDNDIDDM